MCKGYLRIEVNQWDQSGRGLFGLLLKAALVDALLLLLLYRLPLCLTPLLICKVDTSAMWCELLLSRDEGTCPASHQPHYLHHARNYLRIRASKLCCTLCFQF
jgi:hypothetical protein